MGIRNFIGQLARVLREPEAPCPELLGREGGGEGNGNGGGKGGG